MGFFATIWIQDLNGKIKEQYTKESTHNNVKRLDTEPLREKVKEILRENLDKAIQVYTVKTE